MRWKLNVLESAPTTTEIDNDIEDDDDDVDDDGEDCDFDDYDCY